VVISGTAPVGTYSFVIPGKRCINCSDQLDQAVEDSSAWGMSDIAVLCVSRIRYAELDAYDHSLTGLVRIEAFVSLDWAKRMRKMIEFLCQALSRKGTVTLDCPGKSLNPSQEDK